MSGIIGNYARNSIIIRKRVGFVDGKPVFEDFNGIAMIFDFSRGDVSLFGAIQNGKVFLVAPNIPEAPEVHGQVIYDGQTYDIHGVKTYRNIKGELVGYKVAVAGGV